MEEFAFRHFLIAQPLESGRSHDITERASPDVHHSAGPGGSVRLHVLLPR